MPDALGRFMKGEHWRPPQPFWNRDWLETEYINKARSCLDIATQCGVTRNAVDFWLKKFGIPGRTTEETRGFRHWGASGSANPMFGKRGELNPNWCGGLTPLRQKLYITIEWKRFSRFIRKRDRDCRICAARRQLEIHHIIPFREAPELVMEATNAILLCTRCHKFTYCKEAEWAPLLRILLCILQEGGPDELANPRGGLYGSPSPLAGEECELRCY